MANARRGEIEACLNGQTWKLCLTLGALAELESAFGDADMLALAQRFEQGRLSAEDAVRIIGAGLRGAGHEVGDEVVRTMQTDNGVIGFVDIVARLLSATFGGPAALVGTAVGVAADLARKEVRTPAPFPGTR